MCALADLKMQRLLNRFDEWAIASGADADVGPSDRPAPTQVDASPLLGLDLTSGEIRTIVWATGYRPSYSWLDIPVLDRRGHLRHDGGIVRDAPGLYVLGLPLLRRRASTFIHGAADDTRALGDHLHAFLDSQAQARCPRPARVM